MTAEQPLEPAAGKYRDAFLTGGHARAGYARATMAGVRGDQSMFLFSNSRCRKYKKALHSKSRWNDHGSVELSDRAMAEVGLSQSDCKWCLANHADELLDEAYEIIRNDSIISEWTRVICFWGLMWEYLRYGSQAAQSRFLSAFWPEVSKWLASTDSSVGISTLFGIRLVNYCKKYGPAARLQPTRELLTSLSACLARWETYGLPENPFAEGYMTVEHWDELKREVIQGYELLEPHAR
jgi:hypothetical protein